MSASIFTKSAWKSTHCHGETAGRSPTKDHLLIFYMPDREAWQDRCTCMRRAGFIEVPAYNPYWDQKRRTFEDVDGYRVVLQNGDWAV